MNTTKKLLLILLLSPYVYTFAGEKPRIPEHDIIRELAQKKINKFFASLGQLSSDEAMACVDDAVKQFCTNNSIPMKQEVQSKGHELLKQINSAKKTITQAEAQIAQLKAKLYDDAPLFDIDENGLLVEKSEKK